MDDEQLLCASRSLQLHLSREQLAGVAAQLGRIADLAKALEEVPLDPVTDEQAPVWRP